MLKKFNNITSKNTKPNRSNTSFKKSTKFKKNSKTNGKVTGSSKTALTRWNNIQVIYKCVSSWPNTSSSTTCQRIPQKGSFRLLRQTGTGRTGKQIPSCSKSSRLQALVTPSWLPPGKDYKKFYIDFTYINQSLLKSAFLFARKAPTPSLTAAVLKRGRNTLLSNFMPSVKPSSSDFLIAFFAVIKLVTDLSDIFFANFKTSSLKVSFLKISVTKPILRAASALKNSPVSIYLVAITLPAIFANFCVPPRPGISPSLISGNPNYESSRQTIISFINASSNPPPNAMPLTAAIIGLLTLLIIKSNPFKES